MSASSKEEAGKVDQSTAERKRLRNAQKSARLARKKDGRAAKQVGDGGEQGQQPSEPALVTAGQVIAGTVVEVVKSGVVLSWGRDQSGFLPEPLMDEATRKSYQSLGQRMKGMIDVKAVVKNTMMGEDGQKVRLTQQADQLRLQVGELFDGVVVEVLETGVNVEIQKGGWIGKRTVGKGSLVGGRNRLRFVKVREPMVVEVVEFRDIYAQLKEVPK